jgi:hypothetical protein
MIGYVTIGTNDLARARSFYDALLAEMGVKRLMQFGDRGYGWAASMEQPMLCVFKPYDGQPATVGNGVMVGIAADSRATVDRVHKKARTATSSTSSVTAEVEPQPDASIEATPPRGVARFLNQAVRRLTTPRTQGATSVTVGNATGQVVAQLRTHCAAKS